MSNRLLVLCPGQGAQHAGMFDLARTSAAGRDFLDRCGLVPDPATMFENRLAQPLIVAASLAMWEALRERVPAPSLAAGYSIGEVTAYAVAGALDPLEAVGVAARRASLMDDEARAHPGQAMAAIGGVTLERAREAATQAGFEIAIVTGEDSFIAGGRSGALGTLESAMHGIGGRFQPLPVAVASHTSLMAGAVAPFASVLDAASFVSPACPVLAGIDASRIPGKQDAVQALSRQLAQSIQWSACMDAAAEAGVTVALELGPGAALARMLQVRHPHIACRSAADFRSLDGIVAWLDRQLE
jgi:[acyl-carrier-protein] S-malonyltransferase